MANTGFKFNPRAAEWKPNPVPEPFTPPSVEAPSLERGPDTDELDLWGLLREFRQVFTAMDTHNPHDDPQAADIEAMLRELASEVTSDVQSEKSTTPRDNSFSNMKGVARLLIEFQDRRQAISSWEDFNRKTIVAELGALQHGCEAAWVTERIHFLRSNFFTWSSIAEMAGLSGESGKRDIELFLHQIRAGEATVRPKLEKFREEVLTWERSHLQLCEEPSLLPCVAVEVLGSERRLTPTELSAHCERFSKAQFRGADWVPFMIQRLQEAGFDLNSISQMAGYSGGNGKRDLDTFQQQLRDKCELAKPKVDKFRNSVQSWERSQSAPPKAIRFLPEESAARNIADWATLVVQRLQEDGHGWSAISRMMGYCGKNGKRDVNTFIRQLNEHNASGRVNRRLETFRQSISAYEANAITYGPRLIGALENEEDEARREIYGSVEFTFRCLFADFAAVKQLAEARWFSQEIDGLRTIGFGWGSISQMVGYGGRSGKRDLESLLSQIRECEPEAKTRLMKFRQELPSIKRSTAPRGMCR